MNTISYKDLKAFYLDNEKAQQTAREVFGKTQPSVYQTGFYSAPSWNWGYIIGITSVQRILSNTQIVKYYEVVTQFGEVKGAREIYIPIINN